MLTRRRSLLLPLALARCGPPPRQDFPALHYDYLTPLRLNVASIQIEQRFVPSGRPPDVSQYAAVPPVQALHTMADDRLQALGSADLAVFVIQDASLTRRSDTLSGSFAVELDIYNTPTTRAAYAQAKVSGTYTGDLDDLRGRLYDMTKDLMDRLNVEFEFQVRRSVGAWLLPAGAERAPVQQQPLTGGQPPVPPPQPLTAPPPSVPPPEPMPQEP